ncbi:PREDICTED: glycerophosphodiester phosphodiesterase 1 isoform X2 [Nicrophorus vespilloides]|uniref:Glycerophosphodiester phosphodiesterase 1 isoform X2 n=1 Tax=Nicrophorus vespilloides TaxID=110193 RepID=A0ABM1MA25_NICVS|nr:PREDICTED: glycerophosphodiester phosphodiesterase 1 isoform X2 [Nicrophorus vespilloides]
MFLIISVLMQTCLNFVIFSYGLWYFLIDVLYLFLPFGLIPTAIIFVTLVIFKVPKPSNSQLERIVGRELYLENGADDRPAMRTVGHRGAGLDAPENSLAAFKICEEKNCSYVEFDITLTKDLVPVVFHDTTLERTANVKLKVKDITYAELMEIDIAMNHPFKEKFRNTKVPTLEETVVLLLNSKLNMFIDLKYHDYRIVKVVNDLFVKYPELHHRAVVSSFYPSLIYLIRRNNPKIVCSIAYRPYFFSYSGYMFPEGLGRRRARFLPKHLVNLMVDKLHSWLLPKVTYYVTGISLILLHKDFMSADVVMNWRRKGVRVCAWTVNHPAEKQYCSKILKIAYFTDTLVGEGTAHAN